MSYFRARRAVIFLSYCRFWEEHPFVQQSLAKVLVQNGVDVIWWDGQGWKDYQPTFYWNSDRLTVRQLPQFPGDRFKPIEKLNLGVQSAILNGFIQRIGEPVIWVQAGVSEKLAKKLPYIDVYSTFDDPFRCSAQGEVVRKAKTILCQNNFSYHWLKRYEPHKVQLAFPPVEIPKTSPLAGTTPFKLPYPEQPIMGYVGSFFAKDYDFMLLENFVKSFPSCNFVLAGRTDTQGKEALKRMEAYPNLVVLSWVPPEKLESVWRTLDISLLFYRSHRVQNGAFPTKVLECYRREIPILGTRVPKNQDILDWAYLSNSPEKLKQNVFRVLHTPKASLKKAYAHFSSRMDPKFHLGLVSNALSDSHKSGRIVSKMVSVLSR